MFQIWRASSLKLARQIRSRLVFFIEFRHVVHDIFLDFVSGRKEEVVKRTPFCISVFSMIPIPLLPPTVRSLFVFLSRSLHESLADGLSFSGRDAANESSSIFSSLPPLLFLACTTSLLSFRLLFCPSSPFPGKVARIPKISASIFKRF